MGRQGQREARTDIRERFKSLWCFRDLGLGLKGGRRSLSFQPLVLRKP